MFSKQEYYQQNLVLGSRLLALGALDRLVESASTVGTMENPDAVAELAKRLSEFQALIAAWPENLAALLKADDRRMLSKLERKLWKWRCLDHASSCLRSFLRQHRGGHVTDKTKKLSLAQSRRAFIVELLASLAASERKTLRSCRTKNLRALLPAFESMREKLDAVEIRLSVSKPQAEISFEKGLADALNHGIEKLAEVCGDNKTPESPLRKKFALHIASKHKRQATLRALLNMVENQVFGAGVVIEKLEHYESAQLSVAAWFQIETLALGSEDESRGAKSFVEFLGHRVQDYKRFLGCWEHDGEWVEVQEMTAAICMRLGGGEHKEVPVPKRFLLSSLPRFEPETEVMEIYEGFLPGRRLSESVRRVRSGDRVKHFRCVRLVENQKEFEVEEETSGEYFETIWPLTEGQRLRKRRYRVVENDRRWEIDEYHNRELNLAAMAELEEQKNSKKKAPKWIRAHLDRDVTGDANFDDGHLAN